MTRRRLHALLVAALAGILLALVAAGCGGSDEDAVDADTIAVVDGEKIPKSEFDALIDRSRVQYKTQQQEFPKAGTAEYRALQAQVVTYLVRRAETEKEAAELGITVTDAEVEKRIAEVKKQYYEDDDKKLQAALKQQGYSMEALKDQLHGQLLSEKLVERLTKDVSVPEIEIRKYYEDNKSQYLVPESREVRHILVKTKDQAASIRAQLRGGADFASLAKKYSLDPGSKTQGGKLTIAKGQTVPSFERASFSLATNELSAPIKTQFGFHLIEPLGPVKKSSTTPYEDVKAQIRSQLEDKKRSEIVTKWSEDLAKKYEDKVTYAKGFAPPPAATTETTG